MKAKLQHTKAYTGFKNAHATLIPVDIGVEKKTRG